MERERSKPGNGTLIPIRRRKVRTLKLLASDKLTEMMVYALCCELLAARMRDPELYDQVCREFVRTHGPYPGHGHDSLENDFKTLA